MLTVISWVVTLAILYAVFSVCMGVGGFVAGVLRRAIGGVK